MYKFYTMKTGVLNPCFRKFLLIMRLTIVFILGTLLQLSAATTFGQRITVSMRRASLENVLKTIRTQSGYDIIYDGKDLSGTQPVDMSVKNATLQQAMNSALSGQHLTYHVNGKVVVIKRREESFIEKVKNYIAAIDVRGKVVDEEGRPMSGATITVKGTNRHVLTNNEGEFFIAEVQENAILSISFLSYETIEVKAVSDMSIQMVPATSKLEEVNISYSTGYQKVSKERATGSFSKPDMKVFSQRTGSMDVMSRLDGLVPGLTILAGPNNMTGNDEKGRTQRALVRGKGTVRSSSEPLYVVNGMPVANFSNINPDDVEDITVLKDAAAAAIWGARAANGVIIVTTKSGSKDKKLSISYSSFFNFQGKPDRDYLRLMNSSQYIQTAKELFNPTAYRPTTLSGAFVAPHERIMYDGFLKLISEDAVKAGLDSLANIDNSGQLDELWYRNAMSQNHTLSIGGGNQYYSAYTSVSYTNDRSNTRGQKSETYKLNLNQTFNPTKYLSFSLFTALNNAVSKGDNAPSISADVIPYQLFKDAQGNNISMPYMQSISPDIRADYEARSRISLDYNPLDERGYGFNDANRTAINIIGGVELKLFQGLAFQGNYGFQKSPGTTHTYRDSKSYALRSQLVNLTVAPTVDDIPVYYLPTTGGTYQIGESTQKDWTVRNQLVYNSRVRQGKDYLSLQFGQEAQEQYGTSSFSTLRGYDLDLQTYAAIDYNTLSKGIFGVVPGGRGGLSELPFSSTDQKSRFISYFALANYTFDGKYSIDGSWRTDRTTLVGSDQSAQDKPVWSVGAKWEVTKENFMKDLGWLDNLGVRATYGITGNSPRTGESSSKDILKIEPGRPVPGTGAEIDVAGNDKLSWESTRTINFGINFSVLKSRLSGNIDMYNRNTTNLLAAVVLNPFSSFGSSTGNLGELSNKGIEIGLTSNNYTSRNFNWSSTFTFSYNYNKLVSYEEDPIALSYATSKVNSNYLIGYSMNSLFAYQYAGLDNMGDPLIRLKDGTVTKNRNLATPDDVVYMGTTIPKFNGGLSNTFSYKDFSISANLVYNLGHVMRKETLDYFTGRLTGNENSFTGNLSTLFLDRWKQPGDELKTNIPAYVAGNANNNRRELSYYSRGDANVVSASYIKLRDVSLSYSLPASALRTLHISSARLFVQATNFLVWTANKEGIDPEYASLSEGTRTLPPFKHSFSIGTNISF
ncbi:SusC/RagA family TonB-linked outer membrane protein [Pedobacter sp. AW31-3R]|uniref:SusC/RagA family TonB-linked outer membrane protein n=1 Tax=Pedobacter sp. AW31-3R TaxID=3445781 RepID=UPI003F9FAA09